MSVVHEAVDLLPALYGDVSWETLPLLTRVRMLEDCRSRGAKLYETAFRALQRVVTKEGEMVTPEALHQIVISALDRLNPGGMVVSPSAAAPPPRALSPSSWAAASPSQQAYRSFAPQVRSPPPAMMQRSRGTPFSPPPPAWRGSSSDGGGGGGGSGRWPPAPAPAPAYGGDGGVDVVDAATLSWLRGAASDGSSPSMNPVSVAPLRQSLSPRVDPETIAWLTSPRYGSADRGVAPGVQRSPPPMAQARVAAAIAAATKSGSRANAASPLVSSPGLGASQSHSRSPSGYAPGCGSGVGGGGDTLFRNISGSVVCVRKWHDEYETNAGSFVIEELAPTGVLIQQGESIVVNERRYRHTRDALGTVVRRMYLRLADGRGWVPLRHISGKSLFQISGQLTGVYGL